MYFCIVYRLILYIVSSSQVDFRKGRKGSHHDGSTVVLGESLGGDSQTNACNSTHVGR